METYFIVQTIEKPNGWRQVLTLGERSFEVVHSAYPVHFKTAEAARRAIREYKRDGGLAELSVFQVSEMESR